MIVSVKPITNKVTHATVTETLARLRAEVEARPQIGTPILQAAPLAGLDLPLKVLVREDRNRTCVSYTAPAELAARYRLSDELAAGLSGIDAVTDAVVGR